MLLLVITFHAHQFIVTCSLRTCFVGNFVIVLLLICSLFTYWS